MTARSVAPSAQRLERSARKLNRKAALEQKARGLSNPEIASLQGVAVSTVRRFMERMKPEEAAITEFKQGRADVLARIQAKSLELQERIIDSLGDGVVDALAPHQKSALLHSLNTVAGTLYDKERLERGQSTSNLAVMGRIMGQAHGSLWSDRVTPQESSVQPVEAIPPPTPGGGTSEAEQAEGAPDRVPSAENGAPGGPSAPPVGNRSRAAKTTNKKRVSK